MVTVIPIAVAPPANSDSPLQFQQALPLSLYIHIPWCVQKCPYCDFNSHTAKAQIPEKAYIAALIADLESALPLIWGRPLTSIFFGGGTPSLFSPDAIDHLLGAIRARLRWLPDAEVTLEANPGTVEAERFAGYRSAGINRLSLGIQSFDDAKLSVLGRIHDGAEARRAAELAAVHFDNFNLDLMVGLPGQNLAAAINDLDTALCFAPSHLSAYQLTLEPNTRFAAFPPSELPDPDLCADMQDAIEARLASAGFTHYETSAFAREGKQSRHNLNYWQFGDYLGIGAGAHSKLTRHDQVLRQMRHKHPEAYLNGANQGQFVQDEHAVGHDELPGEFMMNALRLLQGFDPALFTARTSLPLAQIMTRLRTATDDGLLNLSAACIAPSDTGRRFLNRLLERFL